MGALTATIHLPSYLPVAKFFLVFMFPAITHGRPIQSRSKYYRILVQLYTLPFACDTPSYLADLRVTEKVTFSTTMLPQAVLRIFPSFGREFVSSI